MIDNLNLHIVVGIEYKNKIIFNVYQTHPKRIVVCLCCIQILYVYVCVFDFVNEGGHLCT